jgi:predicted nucleic acid-binding Zn ribbon protein
VDEKTVFFLFEKILSEEYGMRGKENVQPYSYEDKVLFLYTEKSLWLSEMDMENERLRERLNALLGGDFVQKIYTKRK